MRGGMFYFVFPEKPSALFFKVFPFASTPEIIEVEEPASQQILPNLRGFLIRKYMPPGPSSKMKRIFKQVRIHRRDDVRIGAEAKASQAKNTAHEPAIAAGIVRPPTPALWWEKILTTKLGTLVLWRNRHRGDSEPPNPL